MKKTASLSMRPSLPDSPQFSHSLHSGGVFLGRERVRLATTRRASRRSPHHPTKLIVLPTSRIDKGTQGDRRHCLCEVLSLTKGLGTGRHIMQQKLYWLDYDPI